MTTLAITQRDPKASLEALRAAGKVPGVLYGPKEASTPIAFDRLAFEKVLKQAGESTVVTLTGVGEEKDTLIHALDIHPVTGTSTHVDFYVMEKGKKVTTHVPLEFTGEAPAVKSLGGTLIKVLHEIEIEAMPKDLPHEITIDISTLTTFDSHIAVKNIILPSGVTLITDPEEIVASVARPQEVIEETPVEQIDMASIEVEKKGKEESDDDAAGEQAAE